MTSENCITLSIVALMVGLASPAFGADSDTSWQTVLQQMLVSEKKCQFRELLWVREVPLAGYTGLEGRVRCVDGREFDFTRPRPHMKFEIQLCQPTVC